MQKKAGRETKRLSFKLILTIRPANISSASPREEIKRIKGNLSPTNKPKAPVISNKTIVNPSFSKPNRLNSFFICGSLKQEKA